MALRTPPSQRQPPSQRLVEDVAREYHAFLPARKDAAILDMGYGDGWFMAACLSLGYTNISGAEFAPERKEYMRQWNVKLYKIESDIGEFLRLHPGEYDFIRWPFTQRNRFINRLFGVNFGDQFGGELIATAKRGNFAPLFDERYR